MKRFNRRSLWLASVTTLACAFAAQAQAQDNAESAAPTGVVGEIVVTGTRLQATGFTTPTPVTVQSLQRIEDRAKVNIADALNEIPSFQPTAGPGQAQRNVSGQQGASTIDLRGLGAGRTLVLLDGRRYVPVAPSGVVDVSVIPTNLISRVEVVTGGASAQYGSDAVAGVVNFILNDKLEGLKATAQYGFSQHGDNLEPAINLAAGHSFMGGRLHVIGGVDWSKNDGVGSQYTRDWGKKETGIVSLGANRPAGVPANVLADYQEFSGLTAGGLITSGPLAGTAFDAKGNPVKFGYGSLVGPTLMVGGPSNANYGNSFTSQQNLLNPTQRLSSLARANFELTPSVTLYAEFSYARDEINTLGYSLQNLGSTTLSQAGTSPTGGFLITNDNPYLNQAALTQMANAGVTSFTLGKLSTDLGLWRGRATTTVMRGVVGAKGEFAGGWKWDAYFQDGDSSQSNLMFPTNKARLFAAAWAKPGPNGQPVCGPIATNPYFSASLPAAERANRIADLGTAPCVPFNPFGTGVNSQAVQDYIRSSFNQQVVVRQYVGAANVSGTPFSTWAGPVSVAVGGEFRRDSAYQSADPNNVGLRGGFLEFNGTPLSGSNDVGEGFFETGIPLMKDTMFGKALNLNGAVRETHYQLSGYVTTWKVGATYDPVDWFRIRTTRSRDIAAPRISQLYAQGGGANYVVTNPVNHVTDSVQGRTNGNPNLQPEVADTFTGGFVFSPKWDWASGFRASVDYYDITINGVISSLQPPQIVDRYYRLGQTQYASNFFFDSSALGFSRVSGAFANLTQLKASGVDLEADYRAPIDRLHVPGRLDIAALASYANQLATIDVSGGVLSVTDRVGQTTGAGTQGGPIPKWRETVTFDYNLARFGATLQARIFSGFVANTTLVGPNNANYSPSLANSINDNFAPGGVYWNMQMRYDIQRSDKHSLQAFLNIDNLMDKNPPAYALSLTSAGGIPYDFVGRSFKVGFRLTL